MNRKMKIFSLLLAAAAIHAEPVFAQDGNKLMNGDFDSEKPLAITPKNIRQKIGKHWRKIAQIWSKDNELKKKIYPLMNVFVEEDSAERKNVLVFENQKEIIQHLDAEGKPMIAMYLSQTVPLESSDNPEAYRFSMKAKGSFGERSITRTVMLICNFRDGTGKNAGTAGKSLLHRFAVKQGQWQDLSVPVTLPPGTKSCEILIGLYGVGKFAFDDIRFEKTK